MADTAKITSGTAGGLLEFIDWLVEKGYATQPAVGPWRSAVRQVFRTVEGDEFQQLDVIRLDAADYLSRFENMAGANYKVESLASYRSRFNKALTAYRDYLSDKKLPTFRSSPRRPPAKPTASGLARGASSAGSHRDAQAAEPSRPEIGLIEYPFPLQAGGVARLRLPARLDRRDADRLAAFVRTLVFEPQKELVAGPDDEEAGQSP